MRQRFSDRRLKFYLGDVRDKSSVAQAVNAVDYVFHAAALKQVPSCEFFPLEAVHTNVIGSSNVIQAAFEAEVKTVVCLSTDKAVYPINAMGMSKALMEKAAQAFARNHPESATKVCVTRYGNVMYSRGSVIPLFVGQLKRHQPVTVTSMSMTRFMMSLAESVQLVEYAFDHGNNGDLFIQKTPACTIETLVTALGNLFEVTPTIENIGVRHGEKIHETLATSQEIFMAHDLGDYLRIPLDGRDLNYAIYADRTDEPFTDAADYSSDQTQQLNVAETEAKLLQLPEIQAELGAA
jgi:UDP-glucose 4-epimerase